MADVPDGTRRICLHVGCGPRMGGMLPPEFTGPDWQEVRLDIDPNVEPDIVASMVDMSVVATSSVDAVWSSHNLEHLYSHEVPLALREFHRVLKPLGVALLTMPDLQKVAELIAADQLEETAYVSPAGPIAPLDMVYGHRPSLAAGQHFMAHRTGFTGRTLASALVRAGFNVEGVLRDGFNLWARGRKPEHGYLPGQTCVMI